MIAVGIDGHNTNLPDSGEVTHYEIRFWSNQAILEVFSLFLLPFPKIFWHLIRSVQNTANARRVSPCRMFTLFGL